MRLRCPTCKKTVSWEENPHRPFCSERCRLVDLGNWALEKYRIPVQESPAESDETGNDNGQNRNGQEG